MAPRLPGLGQITVDLAKQAAKEALIFLAEASEGPLLKCLPYGLDGGAYVTSGIGQIDAGYSLVLGVPAPLDEAGGLHSLEGVGYGGRPDEDPLGQF
jgi:hypothetical protein